MSEVKSFFYKKFVLRDLDRLFFCWKPFWSSVFGVLTCLASMSGLLTDKGVGDIEIMVIV